MEQHFSSILENEIIECFKDRLLDEFREKLENLSTDPMDSYVSESVKLMNVYETRYDEFMDAYFKKCHPEFDHIFTKPTFLKEETE